MQYVCVGVVPPNCRCKYFAALGGEAAPWLSLWESWHGVAVTERVYAVANMEKVS